MLIYEYKCTKCDYHFEKSQNMTDMPLTECPECDGVVERLISGGSGFLFKTGRHHLPDSKCETCCPGKEECNISEKCCE